MTRSAALPLILLTFVATPAAEAGERRDQNAAMAARQRGGAVSVREIEARVLPTMRGAKYLGFDFDSGSAIYTLKFLRDGQVIWVDVDGQSGQVLRRTGH